MAANSVPRRIVKTLLRPVLNDRVYSHLQSLPMAWDIRTGNWSEPELDVVRYAVRPGDTVVDIGANYGMYTYHLGRLVGPSGTVWAFEPVPFTSRTLAHVLTLLRVKNARLIPKGCGDRAGPITFRVPLTAQGTLSAGLAHLAGRDDDRPGKETQVRWSGDAEVTAELVRLDDFLPPLRDLSFVKCDIEGAEPRAFGGAVKLFDQHLPTVLCEVNPWYLEGFGEKVEELVGPFQQRGYGMYRYDPAARRLRPVAVSDVVEANYFFVHPSRKHRLAALLEG